MDSDCKRRRLGDQGSATTASTLWASRLLEAHAAVVGALPVQQRPVIVESLCTGMATHAIAMKVGVIACCLVVVHSF